MSNRRLWKITETVKSSRGVKSKKISGPYPGDEYDAIFRRFSSRPSPKGFVSIAMRSLVVGQEFILTCLLLAVHRTVQSLPEDEVFEALLPSLVSISAAFFLVILHNSLEDGSTWMLRKTKARQRLKGALFMAVILRYLAAVLRTLTGSYSSDTVHALAIVSLVLHCLACDYSYANGVVRESPSTEDTKHSTFQGGTLSLTSAFFSTTLLVSRLESNATVYLFICFAVVLFGIYPAARYQVAINTQSRRKWVPLVITGLLIGATFLQLDPVEIQLTILFLILLLGMVPLWAFLLQHSKVTLRGPWDIAHV